VGFGSGRDTLRADGTLPSRGKDVVSDSFPRGLFVVAIESEASIRCEHVRESKQEIYCSSSAGWFS
jgi:hypothetical protein